MKGRVFQIKVQESPKGVKILVYGKSDRGSPRLLGHAEVPSVRLSDDKVAPAVEQLLATIEGPTQAV